MLVAALLLTACGVDRQPLASRDAAPQLDSGAIDAGRDAMPGLDASRDATTGTDSGFDASVLSDASVDGGVDSGIDSGIDSGVDSGFDSGIDSGIDSGVDSGVDSGIDSGVDSGTDAGTLPSSGCGGPLGKRKLLTVNGSRVTGTLTNFPVLVSLIDADLAASATQAGTDLCFTDSTGVTPLPFEVERWTKLNGTLVAWVALPTLATAQATTFYLHYGGTGNATVLNPTLVWDVDFAAVYHLAEEVLPDYTDSTANANLCANVGAVSRTGQIAPAASFDGDNDEVDCGSDASVDDVLRGGGTLEAWIHPASWGEGSYGRILDKSSAVTPDKGWGFYVNDVTRTASIGFSHSFGRNFSAWFAGDGALTLNAWQHVALTYNSTDTSNDPSFYINGVLVPSSRNNATNAPTNNPESDAAEPLVIGNGGGGTTRTFDGTIDEVRVSRTIRSAQWLATSHANQVSPSTFISVGLEENTL